MAFKKKKLCNRMLIVYKFVNGLGINIMFNLWILIYPISYIKSISIYPIANHGFKPLVLLLLRGYSYIMVTLGLIEFLAVKIITNNACGNRYTWHMVMCIGCIADLTHSVIYYIYSVKIKMYKIMVYLNIIYPLFLLIFRLVYIAYSLIL